MRRPDSGARTFAPVDALFSFTLKAAAPGADPALATEPPAHGELAFPPEYQALCAAYPTLLHRAVSRHQT